MTLVEGNLLLEKMTQLQIDTGNTVGDFRSMSVSQSVSHGDERRSIDGVQTYFARKRSKYLEGSFYMLSWGILNGDTNEAMRNRPAP